MDETTQRSLGMSEQELREALSEELSLAFRTDQTQRRATVTWGRVVTHRNVPALARVLERLNGSGRRELKPFVECSSAAVERVDRTAHGRKLVSCAIELGEQQRAPAGARCVRDHTAEVPEVDVGDTL